MRLGTLRKILIEDLKKAGDDVDKKFSIILDLINQFIDNVAAGFQNALNLTENISGKVVTVTNTHNVALDINPGVIVSRVLGVIILNPGGQAIDSFKWIKNSDGSTLEVTVTYVSGTSTTSANVTYYVFYT